MILLRFYLGAYQRSKENRRKGWPQANPKPKIRNPKQIQILQTRNSKQNVQKYFTTNCTKDHEKGTADKRGGTQRRILDSD